MKLFFPVCHFEIVVWLKPELLYLKFCNKGKENWNLETIIQSNFNGSFILSKSNFKPSWVLMSPTLCISKLQSMFFAFQSSIQDRNFKLQRSSRTLIGSFCVEVRLNQMSILWLKAFEVSKKALYYYYIFIFIYRHNFNFKTISFFHTLKQFPFYKIHSRNKNKTIIMDKLKMFFKLLFYFLTFLNI